MLSPHRSRRRPAAAAPRPRLPRLLLAGLVLAGLVLTAAGCGRGPQPNLVMVVIDTLRQDHVGCYGYPRDTAPTLCRLAAEGARLDGISPTSWTKPATASILTGLHPLRLQVIERSDKLPDEALSLAEVLRERGYRTLGLSANNWIQYRFGFDQGFDELHIEPHEPHQPATAVEMNERLRRRLPQLAEPYFLYLHYVDPHEPYAPPIAWDGSTLDARLVERGPVSNQQLQLQRFMRRDPQLLRDAIDLYDGEIRSVDDGMAAALEMLRQAGLMENTLLVVTSDHGEEFEDHDRGGHGLTLHREVTRVPLVFHFPGRVRPGLALGAAGLIDVMPTVLELLGIEPPATHRFDGVSLAPALTGSRPDAAPPGDRAFLLHLDLDSRAALGLVRGPRKLLLAGHPYGKHLFDHRADPGERRNLLDETGAADDFAALSRELAETYNDLARRALEQEATTFDEELARRIRALGYIALPSDEPLERSLPARIRPADGFQGGLLGWERPSTFEPCIDTADPADFDQLLEGWRFVELDGRWALERASVALPAPQGEALLSLAGMSHRAEPFTLVGRIDGREVFRRLVRPGRVRIEERLAGDLFQHPVAVLRLESSPAFLPDERDDWQWRLGVFVRSVCLAEATGGGATEGSPAP